jgi:hypothetical protein
MEVFLLFIGLVVLLWILLRYLPRSSKTNESPTVFRHTVDRKKKDSDVSKCYNLSRGGGGFDISVVGESHYQENLRGLAGGVSRQRKWDT